MLDNCEMQLFFIKMDEIFGGDSESFDSGDIPFVVGEKTFDRIEMLIKDDDKDKEKGKGD